MKLVSTLALATFAACGASVSGTADGGGGGGGGSDGGAPVIDAPFAGIDSPAGACPNGRAVYLAFDGITLAKSTTSDATAATPAANWLVHPTATLPAFHGGSAADIAQVTSAIQAYLAPYPIQVVTTRPAAGPYVLIAFGGTNMQTGTTFSGAVNTQDCGDTVKSDVAWVSDSVPLEKVPSFAIGALLYGLGLDGTTDTGDCLCGWGSTCTEADTACTVSASIAAVAGCDPAGTQDEAAALQTAFCN